MIKGQVDNSFIKNGIFNTIKNEFSENISLMIKNINSCNNSYYSKKYSREFRK